MNEIAELNVCHLYPNLLNAYGDSGNIAIMKKRCLGRKIGFNINQISIGQEIPPETDFIFCGGGQDFEQTIALDDLLNHKRDFLENYIENDGVSLFICGGFQLLGQYVPLDGRRTQGLGILKITTEDEGSSAFIGNVLTKVDGGLVYGFENHSYRTYLNDHTAFGTVVDGYGNNGQDKTEGCVYKNTYATYLHGPLFSKNPKICDMIIEKALSRRHGQINLSPLNDSLYILAREAVRGLYHGGYKDAQ